MFWSKIWFFVIAVAAAVALTIALLMPRPAERQRLADERQRVVTACDVVNILLRTNARSRIDLAGQFARSDVDVASFLGPATNRRAITGELSKTARPAATKLIENTSENARPDLIALLDGRGRVVARAGMDNQKFGDSLAGFALVDEALDGYMRDDLWVVARKLYLMAASPVIGSDYVGAVVVGHELDKDLADQFVRQLGVDLGFYADNQVMVASDTVPIHDQILAAFEPLRGAESPIADDCREFEPFEATVSDVGYIGVRARLPGEAGERS
ncbi:MAG: cache domain-containing protein, partial [Myxococcota bacterium]